MERWDETWHRLLFWTNGQARSERLAAQIILHEGFKDLDPSHPLGGRDKKKDAICYKNDKKWIMAAHFPFSTKPFYEIRNKFVGDCKGVESNRADGFVFVTNQKLSINKRRELKSLTDYPVHIYHLERITTILDNPTMRSIRKQFLDIEFDDSTPELSDIRVWFHCGFSQISIIHPILRKIPFIKRLLPSDYGYGIVSIGIKNVGTLKAENIKLSISLHDYDPKASISPAENPISSHSIPWFKSLDFEFTDINRGEIKKSAAQFSVNIQNLRNKRDILDDIRELLIEERLTCDNIPPKKEIMNIN